MNPKGICTTLLATGVVFGLALVIMPNLNSVWRRRRGKESFIAKPGLDDEADLGPIKELVEAKQYEEACQKLEHLLEERRPNFAGLLLMSQLYHHFNKDAEAGRCLLGMIRCSISEEDQLTAMRLYHELLRA